MYGIAVDKLHRIRRQVDQIERRIGAVDIDTGKAAAKSQARQGFGPYFYDYLVDNNYVGPEGLLCVNFHGQKFYAYKFLHNAVDNAQARQVAGEYDAVSIGVMPGFYAFSSSLGLEIKSNPGITPAHAIHFYGTGEKRGRGQSVIGPSLGATGLKISEGSAPYFFYNMNFRSLIGADSIITNDSDIEVHFYHSNLGNSRLSGDFFNSTFYDCNFQGNHRGFEIQAGQSPENVLFYHCEFGSSTRMQWDGDSRGIIFVNCKYGNSTAAIDINAGDHEAVWVNCTFGTSGAGKSFLTVDGPGITGKFNFIGCDFPSPLNAVSIPLWFKNFSAIIKLYIVGNRFGRSSTFDSPYIQCDHVEIEDAIIAFNTFGRGGIGGISEYLETNSSRASVEGFFKNSVFGPNAPGGIVEYNITGLGNEFYPNSSAVGPSIPIRLADINTSGMMAMAL